MTSNHNLAYQCLAALFVAKVGTAERVGFEPTVVSPTSDFKSAPIDHSGTSPRTGRRASTRKTEARRLSSPRQVLWVRLLLIDVSRVIQLLDVLRVDKGRVDGAPVFEVESAIDNLLCDLTKLQRFTAFPEDIQCGISDVQMDVAEASWLVRHQLRVSGNFLGCRLRPSNFGRIRVNFKAFANSITHRSKSSARNIIVGARLPQSLKGACQRNLIASQRSKQPLRDRILKWLRKSEQGDKWNRCLIEGMIVLSETGARDEQTTPP